MRELRAYLGSRDLDVVDELLSELTRTLRGAEQQLLELQKLLPSYDLATFGDLDAAMNGFVEALERNARRLHASQLAFEQARLFLQERR